MGWGGVGVGMGGWEADWIAGPTGPRVHLTDFFGLANRHRRRRRRRSIRWAVRAECKQAFGESAGFPMHVAAPVRVRVTGDGDVDDVRCTQPITYHNTQTQRAQHETYTMTSISDERLRRTTATNDQP